MPSTGVHHDGRNVTVAIADCDFDAVCVTRLLVRFSSRNGFINNTRARAHPKKREWDELCKDDSQDGPNCHTDTGYNAQVATTK
jgi:hypothetical protein